MWYLKLRGVSADAFAEAVTHSCMVLWDHEFPVEEAPAVIRYFISTYGSWLGGREACEEVWGMIGVGIEAVIAQYYALRRPVEDHNTFTAQRGWPPLPIPPRDIWHSILKLEHCDIEDFDMAAVLEATRP
jgi:hypothetical protein